MIPSIWRWIIMVICVLYLELTSSDNFKMRNKGDRHNIFSFQIPTRYYNATLGPETYTWIIHTFGLETANKAGIKRGQSDSHSCGSTGWCRDVCLYNELNDWTFKDVCGRFLCCAKQAT